MKAMGKPELDALVLASRTHLPKPVAAELGKTLSQCRNASFFVQQTLVEKTFPLIFLNLQAGSAPEENGFAAQVLKRLRPAVVARWLPRRERLVELQSTLRQILETSGIRYMFLRGLDFAEKYYPVPPLRVSDDVDLLVPAACHRPAENALVKAGFRYIRKPHFRRAQHAYEGLVELKHPEYPLVVDLRYKLTANAQSGPLSMDMDLLWDSALPRGGGECEMNPADLLVHLIRHISHGHLFETGVVRCCADVAAFLNVAATQLDSDHVSRQAAHCRCLRGLEFFTHFYEQYYACETDPPLEPILPPSRRTINSERKPFVRRVIKKQMALQPRQNALYGQLLRMNLSMITRFWICDNLPRVLRVLHMVACPSRDEAVLIDDENFDGPRLLRTFRVFALMLFVLSPGIIAGLLVRTAVFVLHPFSRRAAARHAPSRARQRL